MQISGTAAIVTGGAPGLGGATAQALAKAGAAVFAFDLPSAIENAPAVSGLTYVAADVTDPSQVSAAVDTAAGADVPLRVAVNCAGIGPSARILSRKGPHDLDLVRKAGEVNRIGPSNVLHR